MNFTHYLKKMRGGKRTPLKVSPKNICIGFFGGAIAILSLALLTTYTDSVWLMAPFGASCVLVFAVWDAPLSQPRNIIGGHFVSALVGLIAYQSFGNSIWTIALATGFAIAAMMLTKTTHPPAGANPIVVIMEGNDWSFLLSPVLLGALIIAVMALLINNLDRHRRYPTFWF